MQVYLIDSLCFLYQQKTKERRKLTFGLFNIFVNHNDRKIEKNECL